MKRALFGYNRKAMLNTNEHQLCQRTFKEVLIQGKDTSLEDATWEPKSILQQFPNFQPREQGCF